MSKKTANATELIKDSSFRRWAKGTASESEAKKWDQWIAEKPSNRRFAIEAQQRISGFMFNLPIESDPDLKWDELQSEITQVKNQIPGKRREFGWLLRVAATFLLASLVGSGIYFIGFINLNSGDQFYTQKVETEFGERKKIDLFDGSTIVLNANSILEVKTNVKDPSNVEVFFEGEALFNVVKRTDTNASHFTVRTKDGAIKVLGTQFVVSTRKESTRVVLKEGSLLIERKQPFTSSQARTNLKPHELAEFSMSSRTIDIKRVNPEVYLSWSSQQLVFDETTLQEVIDRVEFTYGINVIVIDSSLYQKRLSGGIKNTRWKVIVESIAKSLSIQHRIVDDTVFFTKE